ncbi:MAG: ROK family protein [Candidatus Riflebacteria bacterium]|nr:ROK family protein [Candidatus Riflebacteria bacterium]
MEVRQNKPFALGIDLGGTKIAVGLCRGEQIEKKIVTPTPANSGPEAVINAMIKAAREAMTGIESSEVAGVGVGAAGQIDPKTGEVIYAPNLYWNHVPLAEKLKAGLSLPVKVVNDVRAATIAEYRYGSGRGLSDFVNIFVGTGIGSGFVLNGKLLDGATNSAGEIGHICLETDGPPCGCGKKGCFEVFSSGRGMERYVMTQLVHGVKSSINDIVEGDPRKVTGKVIGMAAREGDELALATLRRAGMYLGLAIANVHTMLNPQRIALGGGVMALREFIMPSLIEAMEKHILPVALRDNIVVMAACEEDAAVIGSAALFCATHPGR